MKMKNTNIAKPTGWWTLRSIAVALGISGLLALPASFTRAAEADAQPRNWNPRPPSEHALSLTKLRETRQRLQANIGTMLNSMNDWEESLRKAGADPSDVNMVAAKNRKHEFQKLGQTMARKDAEQAERLIAEGKTVIGESERFQARLGVWLEEAAHQARLNGRIEEKAKVVLKALQGSQLGVDLERLTGQLEMADTLRKIQQNGELDLNKVSADIQQAVAGIKEDVTVIEQERDALLQAEALYAEGAKWTERSSEGRYFRMVTGEAGQEISAGRKQVSANRQMHLNLIRGGEDQEYGVQPSGREAQSPGPTARNP
jgi:hypothetical protein